MLDAIVNSCQYLLNHFPGAQECKEYLDSRLEVSSQSYFQFGYFPGAATLQVLLDMVGDQTLKDSELCYTKVIEDSLGPRSVNFCYFEDYPLILPFRDAYGRVAGLVGRSLLNDEERSIKKISKYKNTKDFKKGQFLFGLYENKQHIIAENSVYIVEGQFDVIKAMEKGIKNIVALGSSNMTNYQFSVISRYTNNIFLLLDNDEAGEKGRKLVISKFGKFANIHNFYLPENYKDIDEYLTKSSTNDSMSFTIRI